MAKKRRDESEPALDAVTVAEPVAEEPTPVVRVPEIPTEALAPTPEVPNLPVPQQPLIELRVFAAMSGIRWDQAAGFLAYAKQTKLGPMTMEQWQAELVKFHNRPVK